MEVFPEPYVARCRPLHVLSGIDALDEFVTEEHPLQRNGLRVGSELPKVHGERATRLLQAFLKIQHSQPGDLPVGAENKAPSTLFRVTRGQHSYPPRKASPQASPAENPLEFSQSTTSTDNIPHSPLSPISSASPLHPDGLMTPLWNAKHEHVVPSIFIAFFSITTDPNNESLHDNQLKYEALAIKESLDASRYRTKFVVVLVGSETLQEGPELEERLANIRRGARMDEKGVFFLSGKTPDSQLPVFADETIASLRPLSNEFYRALSSHARRKRDKGSNPAPSGRPASQGLTRQGWITRYEYKLGMFAEFRNEMDVAERHYTAAVAALYDPQGPLESISTWSPRWNEARLFSDTLCIRLIRCQLLLSFTTTAVRTWRQHLTKMQDILDRRGKGTLTYGWQAWAERWTRIMADQIRDSGLFPVQKRDNDTPDSAVQPKLLGPFKQPEKFVAQEQPYSLFPWARLHHAGYWRLKSVNHRQKRQELALNIPEEDRVPPGQSPASSVVRRSEAYDTYLCPEPHDEWRDAKGGLIHMEETTLGLEKAAGHFNERSQIRFHDAVRLKLYKELAKAPKSGGSVESLKLLWKNNRWRLDQWRGLLQELGILLNHHASTAGDTEARLTTLWELSSRSFQPIEGVQYDMTAALQEEASKLSNGQDTIVTLREEDIMSCLNTSFTFEKAEGHAGERLLGQVVLTSHARPDSALLILSSITIDFSGSIPAVEIKHEPEKQHQYDTASATVEKVDLDTDATSIKRAGRADLSLLPGQTRAYDIELIPAEAGIASPKSAVVVLQEGKLKLEHITNLETLKSDVFRWLGGQASSSSATAEPTFIKKRLYNMKNEVQIHPRPPKVDIEFRDLSHVYYTDEKTKINMELVNGEEEAANVKLQLQVLCDSEEPPSLKWTTESDEPPKFIIDAEIGSIPAGSTATRSFELHFSPVQTDLILEAHIVYTLPSKPNVQITKALSVDVAAIRPFEADHQVHLDWHPNPWPNYFDLGEEQIDTPGLTADGETTVSSASTVLDGIATRWRSEARLVSFATEPLKIKSVGLMVQDASHGAACLIKPFPETTQTTEMLFNSHRDSEFTLDVQKPDLEERRAVTISPALEVFWHRTDAPEDSLVRTLIFLPSVSLAVNEPRVLARRCPQPKEEMDDAGVVLEYVLENPSNHFLTFEYTMDPSDDFAFSGPKLATVNLTPLSRTGIQYVLLPYKRQGFLRPVFKVVDVYFNKALQVNAAGDLESDKSGLMVWVD